MDQSVAYHDPEEHRYDVPVRLATKNAEKEQDTTNQSSEVDVNKRSVVKQHKVHQLFVLEVGVQQINHHHGESERAVPQLWVG